jgi:hypothetical protein
MKALTLWQPWGTLIILGAKPYEFRRWDYRSRYSNLEGQRIVIHAGSRPVRLDEVRDILARIDAGYSALEQQIAVPLLERIWNAHKGEGVVELSAGLGTAILGKPRRPLELFGGKINDSDRIDHSIWAWPLSEVERWEEPIPCRGAQGFWNWS